MSQLQSVERCMEDIEEQLDTWELQHDASAAKATPGRGDGAGARARSSSSRVSATVLYDTVNLQSDTLKNLLAKIGDVNAEMERLGIRQVGGDAIRAAIGGWKRTGDCT